MRLNLIRNPNQFLSASMGLVSRRHAFVFRKEVALRFWNRTRVIGARKAEALRSASSSLLRWLVVPRKSRLHSFGHMGCGMLLGNSGGVCNICIVSCCLRDGASGSGFAVAQSPPPPPWRRPWPNPLWIIEFCCGKAKPEFVAGLSRNRFQFELASVSRMFALGAQHCSKCLVEAVLAAIVSWRAFLQICHACLKANIRQSWRVAFPLLFGPTYSFGVIHFATCRHRGTIPPTWCFKNNQPWYFKKNQLAVSKTTNLMFQKQPTWYILTNAFCRAYLTTRF